MTGADGALAATWAAPANDGGSAITGYRVQWRSVDEDWDPATREVTSPTTSYYITGLTNGTAYMVRVAAVNAQGAGAWSAEATGMPGTPAAGCTNDLGPVSGTVTRTGSWDGSCPSAHYEGKYARYYSFGLSQGAEVTIDLTSSSVDTWLALRNGSGTGSGLVESDDDDGGGTNARITRTLAAGTYTIEATTYRAG